MSWGTADALMSLAQGVRVTCILVYYEREEMEWIRGQRRLLIKKGRLETEKLSGTFLHVTNFDECKVVYMNPRSVLMHLKNAWKVNLFDHAKNLSRHHKQTKNLSHHHKQSIAKNRSQILRSSFKKTERKKHQNNTSNTTSSIRYFRWLRKIILYNEYDTN